MLDVIIVVIVLDRKDHLKRLYILIWVSSVRDFCLIFGHVTLINEYENMII